MAKGRNGSPDKMADSDGNSWKTAKIRYEFLVKERRMQSGIKEKNSMGNIITINQSLVLFHKNLCEMMLQQLHKILKKDTCSE